MTLRVYVSETQLSKIKVGQQVTVKIDTENEMKSYPEQFLIVQQNLHQKSFKRKKNEEFVYARKILQRQFRQLSCQQSMYP
jgi:multidrug resistance efflux pump